MSKNAQKKQKQRKKRQHYVSQFYLRGFANPSGRLFCFDKVSDISHPTTTEAAAQESYFYEISSGSFEGGVEFPINTVENALSSIERMWKPFHVELIRNAGLGTIPLSLSREYSIFVVFQWIRTKTYRDMMHAISQQFMQSIADELVELNFPGQAKVKIEISAKTLPAMHAQKLFDLDEIERMAFHLNMHLWTIGVNNSVHPFYTSDHPVVRRANRTRDGRPMVGIFDPGIEFAFPLDSKHILLILEREHFADWGQHENRVFELSPEQVQDYNGLQVLRSNQRVYCAENDFRVAQEVCKAHPEVRDPNRSRFVIETTPIKDMKNHTFVTALE